MEQSAGDAALEHALPPEGEEVKPAPDSDAAAAPTVRILRIMVFMGAALAVLQALYMLMVVYTGLSLSQRELQIKAAPHYRVGSAIASHINFPTGLALLLAVVLLCAPAATTHHRQLLAGVRTIWLVVVQALAALLVLGVILAVRATIFFLPPLAPSLSSSQRWEVLAYVTGTAGTAAVAFLAALASMPRFLNAAAPSDTDDLVADRSGSSLPTVQPAGRTTTSIAPSSAGTMS